jgi:hypothetical protein
MVGKAQKSHRARSELNSVFGLEKADRWKRELRGKKFRSDQRPATHFRKVGGELLDVHRLAMQILRKRDRHRTSTK